MRTGLVLASLLLTVSAARAQEACAEEMKKLTALLEDQGFVRTNAGRSQAGLSFVATYFVREGMHLLEGKSTVTPEINGFSSWAFPLALGMGTVEFITGRASLRDILISTSAYVSTGLLVNMVADAKIYPMLVQAGWTGRMALALYTVGKLGLNIYFGMSMEAFLHSVLDPMPLPLFKRQDKPRGLSELVECIVQ